MKLFLSILTLLALVIGLYYSFIFKTSQGEKRYFINKPDEFVYVRDEKKNPENPERPIWDTFRYTSAKETDRELYTFEEPGVFSVKLPKTIRVLGFCNKVLESPVKVNFDKQKGQIENYSENNWTQNCEVYKYEGNDNFDKEKDVPQAIWKFDLVEFKDKNELEKIIKTKYAPNSEQGQMVTSNENKAILENENSQAPKFSDVDYENQAINAYDSLIKNSFKVY